MFLKLKVLVHLAVVILNRCAVFALDTVASHPRTITHHANIQIRVLYRVYSCLEFNDYPAAYVVDPHAQTEYFLCQVLLSSNHHKMVITEPCAQSERKRLLNYSGD